MPGTTDYDGFHFVTVRDFGNECAAPGTPQIIGFGANAWFTVAVEGNPCTVALAPDQNCSIPVRVTGGTPVGIFGPIDGTVKLLGSGGSNVGEIRLNVTQ